MFLFSVFRIVRALLILTGAAALIVALAYTAAEESREAIAACFVTSGLFVLALWTLAGSTRAWLLAFALVAAGFAIAGRPVSGGVTFVAALLPMYGTVASTVAGVRYLRRLRDLELEPVAVTEAEKTAAEFEDAGFRHAGRYRVRVGEDVWTVAVMIVPDMDRFAGVHDRGAEVVSRFGARTLVTTTRAEWPVPDDVLRQEIVDGRPGELNAAHQAAIGHLGHLALQPDSLQSDAEAVEASGALHVRTVRFSTDTPLKGYLRLSARKDEAVLGDDEPSRRRIEAWLGTQVSARAGPA